MRAIFELDMPENCYHCPIYNGEYAACQSTGEFLDNISHIVIGRGKQCPLIPIVE